MLISMFLPQSPKIGPFEFDAILEDVIESNVRTPLFPLEIQAEATDHIIVEPKVYTITGAISNTPIKVGLRTLGSLGVGALSNLFGSQVASQVAGLTAGFLAGTEETRSGSTLSALLAIQTAGQMFNLTTADIRLDNMIIRTIRRTRTPATEHGFTFTAEIAELPLVSTVLRANRPLFNQLNQDDPSITQAAPVVNQGELSTFELTNPAFLSDIA